MGKKNRNFSLIVMANILLCGLLFINPGYAGEPGGALRPGDIRENIYASTIFSATSYLMIGDRGKIFQSVDGGKSWQEVPTGTTLPLFSITFPDSKNGWISGKSGLVLHTSDGGMTWSKQDSGTKKHLLSISFGDALHGCAVGDWGAIVLTKDGGTTWQSVSLKEDVLLYGVRFADSQRGWAVGEFGRIFGTVDGGKTWGLVPSPMMEKQSLFCLAIDGGSLYAAGIDGVILYSKNLGKSWQRAKNESKNSIYDITVRGQTGWAVGNAGTVLYSKDSGESWQPADVQEHIKLFWIGTVSLRESNPFKQQSGFVAGAHGLFLTIMQDKLR